jgi:predicted nucleic acid-binding Zn ribbon protein
MASCLQCGKEFVKASGAHKFCTPACRDTASPTRGPIREVSCLGCSTKFETTDTRKTYCGQECRWKHLNSLRITSRTEFRNCVVCGKPFQPMQKTGPGRKWCSEACKHVMGGNPVRLAKMESGEADAGALKAASESRRKWSLKKTFGISLDQFNAMLEKQNGVCAICKQPEYRKNGWNKKTRFLAVDHNHTTGKIRSLLCSDCNTALGLLGEDIPRIQAAIEYLKEHSDGLEEANDD